MSPTKRFLLVVALTALIVLAPPLVSDLLLSGGGPFSSEKYGTSGQWLASIAALAVLFFLIHERQDRHEENQKNTEAVESRAQRSAALLTYPSAVDPTGSTLIRAPEAYRAEVPRVFFRNDRHAPLYDLEIEPTNPPAMTTWGIDGPFEISFLPDPWPMLAPGDTIDLMVSERPVDHWACLHFTKRDLDNTAMTRTSNFFGFRLSYSDEEGRRWSRVGNNVTGWEEPLPTRVRE